MGNPTNRTSLVLAALLVVLTVAPVGAHAEQVLSANDLQPVQITSVTTFDAFTIYAKSDKGVTIEAVDVARTAADGEVFNRRIKLNGGGAPDYRSIHVITQGKAELTIYLNSSSKTDARVLKVVDASGAVLAELPAPPDDGAVAGIATFAIAQAGEYAIFSANSGINVYQILVK